MFVEGAVIIGTLICCTDAVFFPAEESIAAMRAPVSCFDLSAATIGGGCFAADLA